MLFWDGLDNMRSMWNEPEYNHGFMIPFVALYLLWTSGAGDHRRLVARVLAWRRPAPDQPRLAFSRGRSSVFAITQYAFVLALWALVYAAGGTRGIRLMWVPLLYLAFMVPLPDFLTQKLTASLQLLSSEIGVAVIRAAGLSVYLEGNVIDLGAYQLQVAEACSGMRYLFPLMSFGFLCAVLFRGRWWQKAILFFVTIPLTILMNSFRIGVIGILVNFYGIEQAEGFLHDFEGWVIFMACVGVLFAIIFIFARMEKRPFLEIFGPRHTGAWGSAPTHPDAPAHQANRDLDGCARGRCGRSLMVTRQPLVLPERASLATLPLSFADWTGRDEPVEQIYLDALKTSDYLMAHFRRRRTPPRGPVDCLLRQPDPGRRGALTHRPASRVAVAHQSAGGTRDRGRGAAGGWLRVNRVEIALGEERQPSTTGSRNEGETSRASTWSSGTSSRTA